jgi:hypothetical protein
MFAKGAAYEATQWSYLSGYLVDRADEKDCQWDKNSTVGACFDVAPGDLD